ncbi:uncharacterized protein ARMOST_20098 [Armillaria ostoyae]|uniref:Uncharacterized protein n=1 Tax=Armillaria ostoyae TaxID=47428 RepID=A0A284S6D3_ARMOS|nr:uncharacterized protein ARMOST_20098 [Armillaria ostoyae]
MHNEMGWITNLWFTESPLEPGDSSAVAYQIILAYAYDYDQNALDFPYLMTDMLNKLASLTGPLGGAKFQLNYCLRNPGGGDPMVAGHIYSHADGQSQHHFHEDVEFKLIKIKHFSDFARAWASWSGAALLCGLSDKSVPRNEQGICLFDVDASNCSPNLLVEKLHEYFQGLFGDVWLGQTLNWQNVQNNPKRFYDTRKYKFPSNMLHNLFDLNTGSLYAIAKFLLGLQEPFQFLVDGSTVDQQAKPNASLNDEAEAHVDEEPNVHINELENNGAEAHVEEPDTHVDEGPDAHLNEEPDAHINELEKTPYPCLNNNAEAHIEEPDAHVDEDPNTRLNKEPNAHIDMPIDEHVNNELDAHANKPENETPDNDLNKPTINQPDIATKLGGECSSFKLIPEQPAGKALCPSGGTEKGKGRKRSAESHVASVSGIVSPPSKRTRLSILRKAEDTTRKTRAVAAKKKKMAK